MMADRIFQITDSIISIYRKYGDELYFGEGVTQLQHALQAANLAKTSGYDDETILAAFLHDIGHLCIDESDEHQVMDSYGVVDHETLGANFLRKWVFPIKYADLLLLMSMPKDISPIDTLSIMTNYLKRANIHWNFKGAR